MNNNIKIGCIIATLVLGIVLVVGLWLDSAKEKRTQQQIAEYKAQITPIQEEIRLLEEENKNLKENYESKSRRTPQVVLCFGQMDSDLYDEVYPLLQKYGYKGVFIMKEGKVPGEDGVITKEQYNTLIESGWQAVMGGTDAFDLADSVQDSSILIKWKEYLTWYIMRLVEAGIEVPDTYCFEEKEYQKDCDAILQDCGFKIANHYGEKRDIYEKVRVSESEVFMVGSIKIKNGESEVQSSLEQILESGAFLAVTADEVSDIVNDASVGCSIQKYRKLLEFLDSGDGSSLKVSTFQELYSGENEMTESSKKELEKIQERQEEIQQRIDRLKEQIESEWKSVKESI